MQHRPASQENPAHGRLLADETMPPSTPCGEDPCPRCQAGAPLPAESLHAALEAQAAAGKVNSMVSCSGDALWAKVAASHTAASEPASHAAVGNKTRDPTLTVIQKSKRQWPLSGLHSGLSVAFTVAFTVAPHISR